MVLHPRLQLCSPFSAFLRVARVSRRSNLFRGVPEEGPGPHGYCNGYVLNDEQRTLSGLTAESKVPMGGVYSISSEAALINRAILEVAQSPLTGRNAVQQLWSTKAGRKRFTDSLAGALARQTADG